MARDRLNNVVVGDSLNVIWRLNGVQKPLWRFDRQFDEMFDWWRKSITGGSRALPIGWTKLNFDGSSLGNPGPAGIGRLYRDFRGDTIWAYSGPLGLCNSNEAEVRAVHQGIKKMARDLIDSTIVEGDSLNVVRWLRRSVLQPWRFWLFFDEISDLVDGSSIVFNHVRRSANCEVDSLARSGVDRLELESFDFLPP
ncbi:uncharacterized protein LOC143846751 [Tasmannia lanceolata]|uniref:uncharacterized protein LOC143846751 n=1 Tax=Tasmannia lanceolata TaxID=3420 RepID=UPI0040641307